jgi:hypothetical protein
VTVDSASDCASCARLTPTSPPMSARPACDLLFPRIRRRRDSERARSASPRSSIRILPQTPQDANSPSTLSLRTTPQWPHRHNAVAAMPPIYPRRSLAPWIPWVVTLFIRKNSIAEMLHLRKVLPLGDRFGLDFSTPLLLHFRVHARWFPRRFRDKSRVKMG